MQIYGVVSLMSAMECLIKPAELYMCTQNTTHTVVPGLVKQAQLGKKNQKNLELHCLCLQI